MQKWGSKVKAEERGLELEATSTSSMYHVPTLK